MSVATFTTPTGDPAEAFPAAYADATIANGASLSGAVDLGVRTLLGVQLLTAWTAAGLTFQGSADGVTYADLFDKDGEVAVAALAAIAYVALDPAKFFGVRFLKVRSGTTGTPVAQGAARTLRLATREV